MRESKLQMNSSCPKRHILDNEVRAQNKRSLACRSNQSHGDALHSPWYALRLVRLDSVVTRTRNNRRDSIEKVLRL